MDAVIFDMDGILIDSERIYLERTLRFLKQEGIPFQMADVLALAGGSSAHAECFVRKVAGSDVDMADFFRRMDACCPMPDAAQLMFPHEREVLTWLAERYPLALASSSRMERIQEVLSACRLDGLFRFCLSGEMFTESKPSPQIYLTAAKMLALPKPPSAFRVDFVALTLEGSETLLARLEQREPATGRERNFEFVDRGTCMAIPVK